MKQLLLPLLGCLALAAWMFLSAEVPRETVGPGLESASAERPAAATARAEALDRDPEPAAAGPVDGVEESRTEVGGAAGAPAKDQVLRVRAAGTKSPAAGAEVFVLALDGDRGRGRGRDGGRGRGRGRPRGRSRTLEPHWSEAAVAEGLRLVADERGEVPVPVGGRGSLIAARRPGEYGVVYLRRSRDQPQDLQLAVDETLVVTVVDGDDRGVAQVPVGLQQRVPVRRPELDPRNMQAVLAAARRGGADERLRQQLIQDMLNRVRARGGQAGRRAGLAAGGPGRGVVSASMQGPESRLDLRMQRTTDASGQAVFRHLQLFRRGPEGWWKPEARDRWQVALLMPAQNPVAEALPGPGLPKELRLRAPAHGSVRVRVVDHDGKPFANAGRISLRVQGAAVPAWTQVAERKEPGIDGVVFPFVGLGLQLQPRVALDDRDFTWNGPVVPGPSREGETRTVDVRFPASIGLLRGRVVVADGPPLPPDTRLSFLVTGSTGRVEGEDLTMTGDGAFQLPFKIPKSARPPFQLEVRDRRGQPMRGVVVDLDNPGLGRTTDVGTLRLEALPVFVSGVVLDDRGEPVPRAAVQLQRERPTGAAGKLRWRDETYLSTRSGDRGEFELRAVPATGRYRVQVRARGHFSQTSDALGAGDRATVVVERIAELVGRVRMPKWLPDRAVEWSLQPTSKPVGAPTGRPPRGRLRGKAPEQRIEFGNLRAGLYDLTVRVVGFRQPVWFLRGLAVEPGQRGVHPQLGDIDLTGLYRYQIRAVDTAGAPLTRLGSPLLVRLGGAGTESFTGFPWNKGRVEIFSREPQLDVVQLNAGFQVQKSTLRPGEQSLLFTALPPVQLTMPGLRAAVGPDLRVRVSTVLVGASGLPTSLSARDPRSGRSQRYSRAQLGKSSGAWLGTTDTVEVPLMRPGRYEVVARLRASGVASVPVSLGKVEITWAGSAPRVRVPVDAAAVQQGLAKVQALLQAKAQQPKPNPKRGR